MTKKRQFKPHVLQAVRAYKNFTGTQRVNNHCVHEIAERKSRLLCPLADMKEKTKSNEIPVVKTLKS